MEEEENHQGTELEVEVEAEAGTEVEDEAEDTGQERIITTLGK